MSRITEARNNLILSQPFFGALSLRLKVEEDQATETISVDGTTLRFNPEWADALPFDQLVGVTAHEAMHCAAGHHARRGGRDGNRWNQACDYAVNPLLIEAGFRLPDAALIRDDLKGLSAEEIYTKLVGEDEKPGGAGNQKAGGDQPGPGDVGGCGSFSDPTPESDGFPTQAELSEQVREWEIATMQAAAAAKAAGDLPGTAAWLVKQIQAPRVSWQEILREFISTRARTEYAWVPPNRRYVHLGLYLPSRDDSRKLGEIVVAIDTSGSISGALLDAFAGEINSIIEDVRPERIHVVYCDTKVRKAETFEPDDAPIAIEAPGRGGTAFAPVWDWVAQQGIEPACAIYFTDLNAIAFGTEPSYPVLWCSTSHRATAPFGEVVKLNL